jgi:hypothetical protein
VLWHHFLLWIHYSSGYLGAENSTIDCIFIVQPACVLPSLSQAHHLFRFDFWALIFFKLIAFSWFYALLRYEASFLHFRELINLISFWFPAFSLPAASFRPLRLPAATYRRTYWPFHYFKCLRVTRIYLRFDPQFRYAANIAYWWHGMPLYAVELAHYFISNGCFALFHIFWVLLYWRSSSSLPLYL